MGYKVIKLSLRFIPATFYLSLLTFCGVSGQQIKENSFFNSEKNKTSSVIVLPEFTTYDRVINLKKGMNKAEVLSVLEVYPYRIIYNENNDCEINVFKCGTTRRSLASGSEIRQGTQEQLTKGNEIYTEQLENLVLFYLKGKLAAFVNEEREEEAYRVLFLERKVSEKCGPSPKADLKKLSFKQAFGCMDTFALNYNSSATNHDSKSCVYVDCGFQKLYLTDLEKLTCDIRQIPGPDLWGFWLADGQCDMIKRWVRLYPPLFQKLPVDFFSKCNPKSTQSTKDCDWCDVIKNKEKTKPSSIQLTW